MLVSRLLACSWVRSFPVFVALENVVCFADARVTGLMREADKNARESLYHRQFEKVQCLGEIKARFYRVQEVGRIPHRDCPSPTSPNGLVKFNRVAEKALKEKAIDLQAT